MLTTRKTGRSAALHRFRDRNAASAASGRRRLRGSRRPRVAAAAAADATGIDQSHDYSVHQSANETLAGGMADTSLPPRIRNERVFARIDQSRRDSKSRSANPSITYQRYIQRMARAMFADNRMSTSQRSRVTLNDFSAEMFELLAEQASQMVKSTDRQTLSAWDIEEAVKIVLGPGMACDANAFARRKLAEYRQNRRP